MTTTEFIKLIKSCSDNDRSKGVEFKDPVYIITESELEKIEKINVDLLEALRACYNILLCHGEHPLIDAQAIEAITNASNIKQI